MTPEESYLIYLEERKTEMKKNNPENEPVGDFTGRCRRCGSNDLWDDCTMYGCKKCGAMYNN